MRRSGGVWVRLRVRRRVVKSEISLLARTRPRTSSCRWHSAVRIRRSSPVARTGAVAKQRPYTAMPHADRTTGAPTVSQCVAVSVWVIEIIHFECERARAEWRATCACVCSAVCGAVAVRWPGARERVSPQCSETIERRERRGARAVARAAWGGVGHARVCVCGAGGAGRATPTES